MERGSQTSTNIKKNENQSSDLMLVRFEFADVIFLHLLFLKHVVCC